MNIFGINGGELIILVVLALVLLGPEKIPEYTRKLGDWVRQLRALAEGAKKQFKEETGTDFDEVDWKKYDPRQYDPRRIIRDALSEPVEDLQSVVRSTGTDTNSLRSDLASLDPKKLSPSVSNTTNTTAATYGASASATAATVAATETDSQTSVTEATLPQPAPFDREAT